MSLKKFFEDKDRKIIKLVDYKASEELLEEQSYTHDFIVSKELTLRRFVPRVDYSDPKNFVFFGNAERYYEDSIKRIYDTYPYDDSPQEKEQWFLSSSYLDLHVFRNDYPSTTGYIEFAPLGWGSQSSVSASYGNPAFKEYIYVKGGPNKNNEYKPDKNKESNLKLDASRGNTVEFFLKKKEFVPSLTKKEVIFDCATNDSDISAFGSSYGRFRIELDSQATGSPFLVTYSSGSRGASDVVLGQSLPKSSVADDNWHHYAVSVHNSGSTLEISLYVDGALNHTVKSGTSCAANDVNFNANIGALVTAPTSTSTAAIGWGKLSGSLDEFRFWKVKRDGKQIGSNWRHQVTGGSNFKEVTGDLGVYFKFNEGITGDTEVDKVVLDYSGRVSNGNWQGYYANCRSTGSAIVESGANTEEFKDPIIRSNHPLVLSLLEEKRSVGRSHDMTNSSALYNTFPNWMQADDVDAYKGSGKLAELVQIISSYFDVLYLQIKVLPGLKDKAYRDYPTPQHLSGSKPAPFADKLLRSSGFIAPELFVESNVVDRILGQDANRSYEQDLTDIKNLIYKNIYNNLVKIYKSKGTESSFRNLLRCFGIDDELIKLNLYSSGHTYKFEDTYLYKSEKVKGINFNNTSSFGATVFQQTSSYGNTHYISGSKNMYMPYTIQTDVIMPLKLVSGQTGFFETNFLTSSIMGMHTPKVTPGDTDWETSDLAGFQVFAVHHPTREGVAKFMLTSSKGNVPKLSTPYLEEVYDDKHWSLSVRVKPALHPRVGSVASFANATATITTTGNPSNNEEFVLTDADGRSVTYIFKTSVATVDGTKENGKVIIGLNGASGHAASVGDRMRAAIGASDLNVTVVETAAGQMRLTQKTKGSSGNTSIDMTAVTTVTSTDFTGGVGHYTVEFSGYNYIVDELQQSFSLSGSSTVSALGGFASSRKSLYVGANRTNATDTVQHSSDIIVNSARVWKGYLEEEELKSHALSFNEYGRLNPSKSAFLFESGSNTTEVNQAASMLLHWNFDQVTGSDANGEFFVADISRQYSGSFGTLNTALDTYHGGTGFGFPASEPTMVRGMSLAVAKENLPENIHNSSLVTIETHDKERLTRYTRPINYYFAFEKSMYQTISEEMVKMFATVVEFNNLIGEPVNKYRPTYKKLDHLRSMFFANVDEDPDLDKYVEFYKWFDVSMAMMLDELRPVSMPGSEGIKNMVESHILERSKYQHRAPTLEFRDTTPEAHILGVNELLYDWEHGHAPVGMSNPSAAVGTITTTGNPGNNETFTLTDADGLSVTYVFKTGVATVDGSKDGDNVIIGVNGATGHAPSVGDRMRAAITASSLNVTVVETAGGAMSLTQNTKGAKGNTNIDMSGVTTVTATNFTGGTGTLEQDNCLWWKDRAQRDELLSVSSKVDSDRETIKTRANTVVSGSTYVIRKLSRPYRFTMEKNNLIDPGSNVATNKINNMHQGIIKFGSTTDAIELAAADLEEQVVCNDVFVPNQKERLHGKMDTLGTDGYLDADSDLIAPFSLYSSSVGDNALSTFKSGVALTNNHGDSYHIDGQIPLQGLFTAQHVGGKVHRDVEVTVSSPELRPEAYALEVTAGKIKIVHQPTNRPRSMFYRNEMIRRPVNIRNIRTTTGSYKVGNYQEVYEYALTNGRRENNNDFAQNDGYTGSLYSSVAAIATGLLDQPKPNRNKNTHVIVNRFSAPGGTEVMGDSNGGPNLDFAAAEYSVYNSMNHRNSLVREVKNDLEAEYSERFGLRSGSAPVATSYEIVSGSQKGFASVHMTNRNELTKYVVASTSNYNTKAILFDGTNDFLEIDETRAIYKNNQSFSVFAWIKHGTVDVSFQHTIWSHHDTSGANRNIFGIKGTSTNNGVTPGTLFFYQEGHSWQSLSSVRIDDNQWHHVGFVYEGVSNTVRLYVDGKAQLGAISISNIADQTNDSSDKVSIGQEFDNASPSDFFKGHMTDVSIWSKPLTNNEVHEIYTDGEYVGPHDLNSHTATSHLAAWYRMGDGDNGGGTADAYNGSIHDMSANSFHAVPTNLAASAIQTVSSELPGTFSVYERRQQRDNAFVQHPIPRNDLQYGWVAASATESREKFVGHRHNFSEPRGVDSVYQRDISLINSSEESANTTGTAWSDFVGLNFLQKVGQGIETPGTDNTIDATNNILTLKNDGSSWTLRTLVPKLSPYGWNSWKQIRSGDHPIARHHKKNNNITLHLRDGEPNTSPLMNYSRPHGTENNTTEQHDRVIGVYQEPPVTSQYKPIELMFGVISDDQFGDLREDVAGHQDTGATFTSKRNRVFGQGRAEIKMKMTYANNICKFANRDLMTVLKLEDTDRTKFDAIIDNMKKPGGVMVPSGFKYSETIYPAEVNLYQKETRLRTSFVSREWRETRLERKEFLTATLGDKYSSVARSLNRMRNPISSSTNSQNSALYTQGDTQFEYFITQSIWPLDARSDFAARPAFLLSSSINWDDHDAYGDRRALARINDDAGELQNSYSNFHNGGNAYSVGDDSPFGALYNRRIQQEVAGFTYLAGEAKWEAGDQSGKYPFEKNYETWASELKVAPDFALVPEFKISDHIDRILSSGSVTTPLEDFLSLTGSTDSASGTFFKTYSNTDFMKYFETVNDKFSSLDKEPSSLFLECKAMLKMLPYEGLYPATRTLALCELFRKEYTDIRFDASQIDPTAITSKSVRRDVESIVFIRARHNLKNASKMLYAPGVLYNSIKSGMAVDYPIFYNTGTGSMEQTGINGRADTAAELRGQWSPHRGAPDNYLAGAYGPAFTGSYLTTANPDRTFGQPRIKSNIYRRISFEEIINPDVLDGVAMYDNEPHPSASAGSEYFAVTSQVSTFFDVHPVYGSIFSGSEFGRSRYWADVNPSLKMGSVENYSLAMNNFVAEVPNFFLKNESVTTLVSEPGPFNFNNSELGQTFEMKVEIKNKSTTMYENPSAFGPPVDNSPTTDQNGNIRHGFAPYTPGFLKRDGTSFVTLQFTPSKRTYTLNELFGEVSSSFSDTRLEHSLADPLYTVDPGVAHFFSTNKTNMMNIDASFNLFSSVEEPEATQDDKGAIISLSNPATSRSRWVIQSKWETPVLDFGKVDATYYDATGSQEMLHSVAFGDVETPAHWSSNISSKSCLLTGSRGMWHQYGELPNANGGYEVKITDVQKAPSLASKVGFPVGQSRKIGEVAETKEISEAIVAIPYFVEFGQLTFCDLDPEDVREVMGELDALRGQIALTPGVHPAVRHQLEMMQKYILPPQLDFLKYRDKSPMAMYIFEFKHELDQQDLVDLWQNLPPKIARHAEGFKTAVVGHNLVKNGQVLDPLSGEVAEKMQWMVFKVKKRAEVSYFKKLNDSVFQTKGAKVDVFREGRNRSLVASSLEDISLRTDGYSYNWPYDYFSLVELIKLDASVVFRDKT